jgi:hypothetical protein
MDSDLIFTVMRVFLDCSPFADSAKPLKLSALCCLCMADHGTMTHKNGSMAEVV